MLIDLVVRILIYDYRTMGVSGGTMLMTFPGQLALAFWFSCSDYTAEALAEIVES